MNITKLEHKGLAQLAFAEHSPVNGNMPENADETGTWCDCVEISYTPFPPMKGKTLSGVLSSLTKKRLADSDGESISLTNDGFQAFKAGPYGNYK